MTTSHERVEVKHSSLGGWPLTPQGLHLYLFACQPPTLPERRLYSNYHKAALIHILRRIRHVVPLPTAPDADACFCPQRELTPPESCGLARPQLSFPPA